MKYYYILFLLFALSFNFSHSQDAYLPEPDLNHLRTAVTGDISLLWMKDANEYRYFLKDADKVIELKNSEKDGKKQEEYKTVIREHTDNNADVEKVRFNLRSLSTFFSRYNLSKDSSGESLMKSEHRLGIFGGSDQAAYTYNPMNVIHPMTGVEYELSETGARRRFSLVARFTHTFENQEHSYSASKFSLNTRYKFIRTKKIDFYVNAKLAEYNFVDYQILEDVTENDEVSQQVVSRSNSGLSLPFHFGVGIDYKIGNGYLNLSYNDIIGINSTANNSLPFNLSLGYKFIL